MPYHLHIAEPVSDEIRRVVLEEIASALEQLGSHARNRDKAIHETRKSIKKIRGVLKLVRPALGKTYRKENDHLRRIAGCLSELRDASAIIETFDSVVHKHAVGLRNNPLRGLRKNLLGSKHATEQKLNVAKVLKENAAALRSLQTRVPDWPLPRGGFTLLESGLKDSYRAGRKALRRAVKQSDPDSFHQFRKRAKDHWYHVRLLENVWDQEMTTREKEIHDLEAGLGDDHNLTVLCEHVQGDPKQVELFQALAVQQQNELRETAIQKGRLLYEQRPGDFVQHIKAYWKAAHKSA